jgi:cyclophilin family peptidyl-prolyl cis-trans isomerase
MRTLIALCVVGLAGVTVMGAQRASAPAVPVVTIETAKGTIEIRLFPSDAPKSVEHILQLVKRNFYRGQRIHRVERTLVQFGDPVSRDVSRRAWWGRASSGNPIGVAEFNKRTHARGAVGLAHSGDPRYADSQLYIVKVASPGLDGKHVVIGQVTRGMDVVDALQVTDVLKQVTVVEP